MTIWRGMTYNPIIDEWENPLSHIFHVHYYQSGIVKDKSFLFVDLHFPDYWWISTYFQVMATCISHSVHYLYALTISLLWYSSFFLIGLYMLGIYSQLPFTFQIYWNFLPVCTCILLLLLMSYNLFILVFYCFWILCDA